MEFTITVMRNDARGRKTYKAIYVPQKLYNDIKSEELVFNYNNLSFRASTLDDSKVLKLSKSKDEYSVKFSLHDYDYKFTPGKYIVEKEGDIYHIITNKDE